MKDGPSYARLNSGVMVHSQAAATILKDQDWPISVEAQFLGNDGDLKRPTPGTEIFMKGAMVKAHCTNSTSKNCRGRTGSKECGILWKGAGVANRFDPAIKVDGKLLSESYIALQWESHPLEFRNIRLLQLKGCVNAKAKNYKPYFVEPDEAACVFGKQAETFAGGRDPIGR